MRSTYASNSIAAGIDVFELARTMGTSIAMIERHYGTLVTGAAASIAERQGRFEAGQNAPGRSPLRRRSTDRRRCASSAPTQRA
jgi:hypothetical protein